MFYHRGKCDQLNDTFIPMWFEQWSHNSDMLTGLLVLNHLIRGVDETNRVDEQWSYYSNMLSFFVFLFLQLASCKSSIK